MMQKIKVLVIDDSRSTQKMLKLFFSHYKDIELIGSAMGPYEAAKIMKSMRPDVILLDVQMPDMDGLTFLKKLMQQHPMPVIIHSSLITKNPDIGIKALEYGAIEVMDKPIIDINDLATSEAYEKKLLRVVRQAGIEGAKKNVFTTLSTAKDIQTQKSFKGSERFKHVICIGASAGGIQALKFLLSQLPQEFPPIMVVQHMPIEFTGQFAAQLNRTSLMTVEEAKDRDIMRSGKVYVAPGDRHLTIKKSGTNYQLRLEDGPKVSNHKPSVDVLFNSAASTKGVNLIGVLLTGMGKDGAEGLLAMKNTGFHTIAQDEATSVVYGMPKKAAELGAAVKISSLQSIPMQLMKMVKFSE